MRKLFTLLLAVAASVGTMFAWDYEHVQIGDLYYNLDATSQTAEVTSQNSSYPKWSTTITTAIIPASVEYNSVTYTVTSIGEYAFFECTGLTSVTIPSSVTSIGNWAFFYCSSLTSVTIPNSVTSIGRSAFSACISLTSVTIPYSVTSIGSGAFSLCSSLTSVVLHSNAIVGKNYHDYNISTGYGGNLRDLFGAKQVQECILGNEITNIGKNFFCESEGLVSVEMGENITSIGERAFYGCSGLTSVTIPNSVTSIGEYAFRGCTGLTSVMIPNSVTSIGDYTFSGCSSLTSVTIPNSITSIGESAFYNVPNIVYSGSATGSPWGAKSINGYVDGYLVYSDNTKTTLLACSAAAQGEIIIPNSVTSIGDYIFSGCSSLTSVTIPNSVTSIGYEAFRDCCSLTSVSIPNSVTSIGKFAFYNCYNLTSVTIPNSVTSIGDYIFSGCSSLTSVTIPNSVTSIGNSAFYNCYNLTSVTISNSVTSIGDYAFSGCSGLTSVTIPNSVTSIGSWAFSDCSSLTSVTIGNSVTSIGNSAFYNCYNLTSVTIPNSVTSIGEMAFRDCRGLTSVTIPNSVTSIGYEAFRYCSKLANIYVEATNPPSISSTTFSNIASEALVHVQFGYAGLYRSANYWKNMNIQVLINHSILTSPTGVNIGFTTDGDIASCGISGGEQQPGNTLEYIGLEPESEYKDVPIVLTSNTGETETVKVSFTTTALELTTKASKPVSGTTAILLAETNMADAEVSCGFEYKRNDAPADMDGTKVYCPVASGQMAGRLKNLKDDVYYKYRAFYQSQAGNMYYGDWQYIFTGDVAVEFDPILYTYGATVVQENKATISGYALAGSEDFTEQGFEYWAETRANGGTNAPRRMPAALNEHFFAQASGISLRATLTNLDAGTVYKYRVYGKAGDQYYYGSEQSFTTKGEYKGDDTEAIEDVQIDNTQSTKAQKILHDGQIYILRGEKVYTLQGQEIK